MIHDPIHPFIVLSQSRLLIGSNTEPKDNMPIIFFVLKIIQFG
jgi:hypothetical protein